MAISIEDKIWLDIIHDMATNAGWEQINPLFSISTKTKIYGRGGQMKDDEILRISRDRIELCTRSNIYAWQWDTILLINKRIDSSPVISILFSVGAFYTPF